jgi:hypothetical protein
LYCLTVIVPAKDNADAFVVEQPAGNPTPGIDKPHFVDPTTPQGTSGGKANPFNFNFTGVRPHETK